MNKYLFNLNWKLAKSKCNGPNMCLIALSESHWGPLNMEDDFLFELVNYCNEVHLKY